MLAGEGAVRRVLAPEDEALRLHPSDSFIEKRYTLVERQREKLALHAQAVRVKVFIRSLQDLKICALGINFEEIVTARMPAVSYFRQRPIKSSANQFFPLYLPTPFEPCLRPACISASFQIREIGRYVTEVLLEKR